MQKMVEVHGVRGGVVDHQATAVPGRGGHLSDALVRQTVVVEVHFMTNLVTKFQFV